MRARSTRPRPGSSTGCRSSPGSSSAFASRVASGWPVDEGRVVEVDGGELVLLAPVVLRVRPLPFGAALREEVHATRDVPWIEVLLVDPGENRHVLILGAQRRGDALGALRLHVVQQP